MRRILAALGIGLAGLAFGVGLGRASVPVSAAPAVEQQAPIGLIRVVDDEDSDRDCHDEDATVTFERNA